MLFAPLTPGLQLYTELNKEGAAGLFTEFVPPPMFEIEMCVKPFISHVNLAILMIMPTLTSPLMYLQQGWGVWLLH